MKKYISSLFCSAVLLGTHASAAQSQMDDFNLSESELAQIACFEENSVTISFNGSGCDPTLINNDNPVVAVSDSNSQDLVELEQAEVPLPGSLALVLGGLLGAGLLRKRS